MKLTQRVKAQVNKATQWVKAQFKKAVVVVVATVAVPAMAAIDTAAAVTEIGLNGVGIIAVGGALITLAATAVGIKWIKGTIFS